MRGAGAAPRGEEVIGCDAGAPEVGRLRDAGVEVHLQTQGSELVARARTLVKSPGSRARRRSSRRRSERGATVIGELELAWRLIPNEFIAVTGTNGKTTTTELIGHIHREAGLPVAVAGNVGAPVADLAGSSRRTRPSSARPRPSSSRTRSSSRPRPPCC